MLACAPGRIPDAIAGACADPADGPPRATVLRLLVVVGTHARALVRYAPDDGAPRAAGEVCAAAAPGVLACARAASGLLAGGTGWAEALWGPGGERLDAAGGGRIVAAAAALASLGAGLALAAALASAAGRCAERARDA